MKYLLDTHILLWYFDNSPKMSDAVAAIIESHHVQKYISIASMFEFAIKHALGKLEFEGGISTFWEMASVNGCVVLPIEEPHLALFSSLPFLHRDPFDRLLIATAIVEDITLLTANENIHKYDVKWQS